MGGKWGQVNGVRHDICPTRIPINGEKECEMVSDPIFSIFSLGVNKWGQTRYLSYQDVKWNKWNQTRYLSYQ